tara:strand:+ start:5346 stop:5843 length:498 start_codon:yes stop_codon:yes gene_type:complete
VSQFTEFGIDDQPPPKAMLTVELVPSTSWGNNLRSRLSKNDWDKLRRAQYAKAGNRCEVCDGRGPRHPVECHEIWSYDDVRCVQTLDGLIALCPDCHKVKHLGFAFVKGKGEQALRHLSRVNDWGEAETVAYADAAFAQHAARSAQQWTLDLEWLRTVGVDPPGF